MTEEDRQTVDKAARSRVDLVELGSRLLHDVLPLPKESLKHLLGAHRELLLAGRSLIDGAVNVLGRLEGQQEKPSKKETAKKVNIQ